MKTVYSKHIRERMEERDVTEHQVGLVITFGKRYPHDEGWHYILTHKNAQKLSKHYDTQGCEGLHVIVAEHPVKEKRTLVTVYRTEPKKRTKYVRKPR